MPTDQVESLTREPREARHVIHALPDANPLKDLIADEHEEKEGAIGVLLDGMSWVVYAVALGALALLTWAMFKS